MPGELPGTNRFRNRRESPIVDSIVRESPVVYSRQLQTRNKTNKQILVTNEEGAKWIVRKQRRLHFRILPCARSGNEQNGDGSGSNVGRLDVRGLVYALWDIIPNLSLLDLFYLAMQFNIFLYLI